MRGAGGERFVDGSGAEDGQAGSLRIEMAGA
jgi:hypothetical protein